jgi:outer membrane protein TolC
MLRRVLSVVLVVCISCSPAFAGQNWVEQFLQRYKPGTLAFPAGQANIQDTLPTLIRNGIIPLSVNDLITLTLENNLDISVNRLSPLQSEFLIRTNYRPFEPALRLGASVSRDTSRSRTQLTGTNSVSQLSHNYTIGYGQTFMTGTDFAVDFTLNRTSSNNAFNTFNPSWVGLVRYSVAQRVLNGYGREVNNRSIRLAQNNKKISEVQFETQVIDMVTQAQKSYWDLVFTAEDLKVKNQSLELAKKTLRDNQAQVDAGVMARIDLVQAQTQVATRNEELIVSGFTQTELEDQVKKLLSKQQDPGLILARLSPTQSAKMPAAGDVLPVGDAIKVAMENRPELRQANLQLTNAEIDLKYQKNQLLPTVDLNASYTQNGVGGTETLRAGFGPTAPVISVTPGGFFDAFGDLFRYRSTGYTLGFQATIPLSNKSQQAQYDAVAVQRMTVEQNIKALQSRITLEVRNAINQLNLSKARIETAQTTKKLVQEQSDAEQKKFDLGATTIRFVLEEQRNLEQAQSNELSAIVSYAKALVDYDRALGLTLKKNNVSIDKALAMK